MATVLYFPEDDFAPPLRISTREVVRGRIAVSAAHARAVAGGRSKRLDVLEASDTANQAVEPLRPDSCAFTEPDTGSTRILTDCAGNPSESRCAKSQLDNILAMRDEEQARKARETVRPID